MIDVDGMEYAQARLSARNGGRPEEVEWRQIEVVRELSACLDAARRTRLRHWTAGIAPQYGVHAIESTLRGHWRTLVAEVSRWLPAEWRAAVAWCATLADLPVLQYLARGEKPLPWMQDDPLYRDLAIDGQVASPAALAVGSLAPLAGAWTNPEQLLPAWREAWVALLPRGRFAQASLLERLASTLEQHVAALGGIALTDGWPLRRALQLRLTLLFRGAILDPAAAFVFLALSALDLERLRGELVRRAAFPRLPLAA